MEKNAGLDLKHFVRWAGSSLYIPPSLYSSLSPPRHVGWDLSYKSDPWWTVGTCTTRTCGHRPAEDKLSYPVGRIIILSKDSSDIG